MLRVFVTKKKELFLECKICVACVLFSIHILARVFTLVNTTQYYICMHYTIEYNIYTRNARCLVLKMQTTPTRGLLN